MNEMNIFDFAMEMEEDGRTYYENLARRTDHPGLQALFIRLAQDEQKHFEIFRALQASGNAPEMQDTEIIAEAKNVFQGLPEEAETLKGIEGDLAAYRHAMKLESDSFRLYEDIAGKEPNPATRKLLLRIAREEHKHFIVLDNIYHFFNAPNQYLAWGEFSNLDEFRQFGRDVDD
jgi:rubrerythrin